MEIWYINCFFILKVNLHELHKIEDISNQKSALSFDIVWCESDSLRRIVFHLILPDQFALVLINFRDVTTLKNMIQDKTNCSFESIQHTESTNLNILKI